MKISVNQQQSEEENCVCNYLQGKIKESGSKLGSKAGRGNQGGVYYQNKNRRIVDRSKMQSTRTSIVYWNTLTFLFQRKYYCQL